MNKLWHVRPMTHAERIALHERDMRTLRTWHGLLQPEDQTIAAINVQWMVKIESLRCVQCGHKGGEHLGTIPPCARACFVEGCTCRVWVAYGASLC